MDLMQLKDLLELIMKRSEFSVAVGNYIKTHPSFLPLINRVLDI